MPNFLSNPALPTLLPRSAWPGTPISENGRFYHPGYPFELGWKDVLKWKLFSDDPYREMKKRDNWRAKVVKDDGFLRHDKDVFAWLGHASFFLRLNGKNILIDPVLGKLSPLMPRYSALPIDAQKLTGIDYFLVTHDHRDHCDADSLRFLAKQNPKASFITGLNMSGVLSNFGKKENITEMGWMQQFEDEEAGLKITYLPTRHWCRRWLTDTNRRLWGAFVLQTENLTIYFGGDSGYGDHFKQTAALFPNIDYAFLGIGAFAPVWFMQSNHMSPWDAVKAFRDLGARRLVPMHFGTFDLSDEPIGEPKRLLKNIAVEEKMEDQVSFATIVLSHEFERAREVAHKKELAISTKEKAAAQILGSRFFFCGSSSNHLRGRLRLLLRSASS